MSLLLVNLNPDLKQLRDEGHTLEIIQGYLVLSDIPYVSPSKEIKWGKLVSKLELANEKTEQPKDHVVYFVGEAPCDAAGLPLNKVINNSNQANLVDGLVANHLLSSKPDGGYKDYHDKMASYIFMIVSHAKQLDPSVNATPFKPVLENETDSVFQYTDTFSSRSNLVKANVVFSGKKIAIIGLGGTGSYILDLVVKCPVGAISLFDGDRFYQHNYFRSPGTPSGDSILNAPFKTDYLRAIYSRMHKHVHSNPVYIAENNLHLLEGFSFVFLCIDKGEPKKLIIPELIAKGIPFIDVGMGIHRMKSDEKLLGIMSTTLVTPEKTDHLHKHISFVDDPDNIYDDNIQIAELNSLNAAFAVLKWKKFIGFYQDLEMEFHSNYTINTHQLTNEDIAASVC